MSVVPFDLFNFLKGFRISHQSTATFVNMNIDLKRRSHCSDSKSGSRFRFRPASQGRGQDVASGLSVCLQVDTLGHMTWSPIQRRAGTERGWRIQAGCMITTAEREAQSRNKTYGVQ